MRANNKSKGFAKSLSDKKIIIGVLIVLVVGLFTFSGGDFSFSVMPVVSGPENLNAPAPFYKTLEWTVVAENGAGTYALSRNDEIIDMGTWESGDVVAIDISETVVGIYEYVIIFTDGDRNNISDSVWISIYSPATTETGNEPTDDGGFMIVATSIVVMIVGSVVIVIFVRLQNRG